MCCYNIMTSRIHFSITHLIGSVLISNIATVAHTMPMELRWLHTVCIQYIHNCCALTACACLDGAQFYTPHIFSVSGTATYIHTYSTYTYVATSSYVSINAQLYSHQAIDIRYGWSPNVNTKSLKGLICTTEHFDHGFNHLSTNTYQHCPNIHDTVQCYSWG